MFGGMRDANNPWDFYDVLGAAGGPRDGMIDLANDVLGVISHLSPNGYASGTPALIGDGTFDDFDRGPLVGPQAWDLGPPDGKIDLANDVLRVIAQYGHSCT